MRKERGKEEKQSRPPSSSPVRRSSFARGLSRSRDSRSTRSEQQAARERHKSASCRAAAKKSKLKETQNFKKNSRHRVGVSKPRLVARELAREARAAPPGAPGHDARVALAEVEAVGQRDDDRRS